jgi:HK97 family phage prohead protease
MPTTKMKAVVDAIAVEFDYRFIPVKEQLKMLSKTVDKQAEMITDLRIKMGSTQVAQQAMPAVTPAHKMASPAVAIARGIVPDEMYKKFLAVHEENDIELQHALFRDGERDFSKVQFKSGEVKSGTTFVMSDGSVDRMGDIVEPKSWDLRQFRKNPVALFGHNHQMPIGKWKNVRVTDEKLMGELVLAKQGISNTADEVRGLIADGVLKAVSVGFKAVKHEDIKNSKGKETGGIRFLKTELIECSVCAVPANSNALVGG